MNYEQILLEQAEAFALHLGEHIDQMPERDDSHRALACALALVWWRDHAQVTRWLARRRRAATA